MYVCMHVCMYACMHVCMFACMHVCMYACMHVCMYACMRAFSHACMHVCMHACMYAGWDKTSAHAETCHFRDFEDVFCPFFESDTLFLECCLYGV